MIVLSHRGYWKTKQEQNQPTAFIRSFDLGFGTETDLRWVNGRFEIRHDVDEPDAIPFSDVVAMLASRDLPLALNIKADGMATRLADFVREYKIENYFVFDMSVPDMRHQLSAGHPVFTRLSEIETEPVLLDRASGVWLDAFESEWYSNVMIENLLESGKKVCVVSPELHGRPHKDLWQRLKAITSPNLLLCTDLPEEAKTFFGTYS